MAMTNVELYEALKEPVGEKAARLIAEVFPAARDLATKQDIHELRHATKQDIDESFSALDRRISSVEGQLSSVQGQLRMLSVLFATFMGSVLAGVFGILATLLVKI